MCEGNKYNQCHSRGYIIGFHQGENSYTMMLSDHLQKSLLSPENCSLYPVRRQQLPHFDLLRNAENPGVSLSFSRGGRPGTYIAFYLGHLPMIEAAIVTPGDGPGNDSVGGRPELSGQLQQSFSLGRADAMRASLD